MTEQNKHNRQVLTDTGPVARAAENDMSLDGQVPQGSSIAAGRDLHMYNVQGNQNQTITNDYSQTVNSHNNIYDNRYIQTGGSNTFVTLDAMENIKKWINAPDPSVNYNAAYENMTKGTGMWLLNHPKLLDWKMNGGLLWLQGKAGSGKTFLLTNVITNLKTEGHMVFYFYFDTLDRAKVKGTYKGLLSSIMLSTGMKLNQTKLQTLYQQYDSGTSQMHADTMKATLLQLLEQHSSAIYIIMDGLDECQAQDQYSVSKFILDLLEIDSKIHVLVSCRHAASAIGVSSTTYVISLDEQVVKSDIQRHIEQVFQKRPLSVNVHKEVTEALVDGAHGQIRWVDCQIQQLQELATRKAILDALKNLPEDLEETYLKALLGTKKGHQKDVQAIFRWLLFGYWVLDLRWLPEILRIDFEGKKLEAAERIEVNGVPKIINSTLVVVQENISQWDNKSTWHTLQLAHPSVKEYILSDQIKSSSAALFHVNDQLAHNFIAQSCMIYLVVYGEDESIDKKQLPLVDYAAENWPNHVKNLQQLEDPIKSLSLHLLTDTNRSCSQWFRATDKQTCVIEGSASPLYYASTISLSNIMLLLIEEGENINAQGGKYGTPLLAAVSMQNKDTVKLLLEKGADVNAQGGNYGTPLQATSFKGYEEIVKLLVENGADVNAQGGEYGTPLQAASFSGYEKVVKLLVEKGADVNAQGGEYGTPLQAASFSGYEKVVKLLVEKGADVNAQGGEYGTPLQAASFSGYEKVVKLLVEKGADVNAQGGEYGTPLQAASFSGYEKVVKLLVEKGADVNAQGGEYGTPLQGAFHMDYKFIIRSLVEKGADVNAQCSAYYSFSKVAFNEGYENIVKLLVEKGADVNVQCGQYGTLLQAALFKGSENLVSFLLEKGADVNGQGGPYGTPLQAALFKGCKDTVKVLLEVLLEKGADVNAQGGPFGTPLQAASFKGYEEIIKLLLEKGADVNVQGGQYGTPLQAASFKGRKDIVKVLLEKGADVNAQGGKYGTPLQAALFKGYEEIVELLVEKGADVNAHVGQIRTHLQAALNRGDENFARVLIEKGPDVGQGLEHALQTAVYGGYKNIVKLLLEKGVNINSQGGRYGNALQIALYHGHKDIVRLLLEKGAELHAPEGEYDTPLQAALYKFCASRLDSFCIKPV
ncbi:hypothetical protein D9758_017900 [Tetrapyrgos nigripes]|uniref:NACHT domain-containing protein n=1 Tax=Tetrapyrgos nigripes TaxID=182062 RepID=A0A8H5C0M3_9AGAR|nr:hypothetical protein D9758_017900 [Tetrapyrgos nigripes]